MGDTAAPQRLNAQNGLSLRLTVDKADYKVGEWITATATLENTTSGPLAVHFLAIEPMRVTEEECEKPVSEEIFMTLWRRAYYHPIVLEWNRELPKHGFAPFVLTGSEDEVKQNCQTALVGARFGDFYPSYTIPPHTPITCSALFEAKKGLQFIDVGLFSLQDFYPPQILALSGKDTWTSPGSDEQRRLGVKFFPKIWLGSLYVKLDVRVK
jgi:hypothetical protein